MIQKFFLFFSAFLLVSFIACGSDDDSKSSNAELSADYEEAVVKVSPSLSSDSSKSLKAITATGVTCDESSVLDEIAGDTELYKQWVGWDNDNNGDLSPSAPDGWMPYKEDDDNCDYVDEWIAGEYETSAGQDDVPDLKGYAVLNKVFFGSGSDTIYGSAEFLDMMITSINEDISLVDPTPATITLPAWFGPVYVDETTSSSSVSLDNVLDISSEIDSSYGMDAMHLGYSLDSTTGEQVVVIYMQFAAGTFSDTSQVSMFYGRKDDSDSLYIKSSFIDFDTVNSWASSHKTELRTNGNDFIIRKANKILGNDEPCCPLGEIYSHALIGGGSIEADSFFVLRWYEGRYEYGSFTSDDQPTMDEMDMSSAIYFIVEFDSSAEYNARFIPLYGKGEGGGATEDLPDNLTSDPSSVAENYFTQKPECADYTDSSQFFLQEELPGWEDETISDFGSWTTSK